MRVKIYFSIDLWLYIYISIHMKGQFLKGCLLEERLIYDKVNHKNEGESDEISTANTAPRPVDRRWENVSSS